MGDFKTVASLNGGRDELTGLLSMTDFFRQCEIIQKEILKNGSVPAMLFMDLNSMRSFNHRYGFEEGNELLQGVGRILGSYFGMDASSRFGQDHFAVITDRENIENRLEEIFQECLKINEGRTLPIRVGIYFWTNEEVSVEVACDRARFTCNTLRNSYASSYAFYDSDLEMEEEKRQYLVKNLGKAIAEGWIKLYHQAIVRSTTGKVCEEEALSRWDDPVYGFLSPAEFIPVLEEAGQIYKLDLHVVERVVEKVRAAQEEGMLIVPQSVNLSRSDFDSCDIVEEIRKRVDAAGIERKMLIVEVTESMVGREFDFMKEQINRFRELGFPVWMDDFGTGYSTLDLLQRVHFDLIKFDVHFMQSFHSGDSGKVILTELMKMAIGLGLDTVCEGVETEEEAQFLREIGCEKLQGYFYHEPLPAEDVLDLLRRNRSNEAEAPAEASYYDAIGRINLYDLAIVANNDVGGFHRYFNMVPIAIIEVDGDMVEIVRSNQSYREFAMSLVQHDIVAEARFSVSERANEDTFLRLVLQCSQTKTRSFVSEKMPNKSTVHSFMRWIADNPVTGASAVAVVILAVVDSEQETTYENIARALAADYFKLYYVDLETENFIEYSSDVGLEELAIERHGTEFFDNARKEARALIYDEDQENFLFAFTKENVIRALKDQGTFTLTYRQLIQGKPVSVNMKAMRMQMDGQKVILGIHRIEAEASLKEGYERSVLSKAMDGTEVARLSTASLNTVSLVVKSCIHLMKTGDFKENVRGVLNDIMEAAQAESARVLLIDNKKQQISIFEEVIREGCFLNRKEQIAALKYEMIAAWDDLISDNNSIIIESEEDFRMLEEKIPEWAETMRRDGCKRVIHVPLRRSDRILGYLYVLNYNKDKTAKIKELIELVSFFLSSEIESYLFKQELEFLSNYDELTGLKNRLAMKRRVGTIAMRDDNCCFGVLTMDLNGLKHVNDTEGHFAGDDLILRTTELLKNEFGEEELYRIGGDEFIRIFPEIHKDEFERWVAKFRNEVLPGSGISIAMGAYWSETNEDVDRAFYFADQYMYADKKAFYEKHPELKEQNRK